MSASDLAVYVGAASANGLVASCWEEATSLTIGWVTAGAGDETSPAWLEIPPAVRDRAVIEVGAELFHRKNTKSGIAQFATPDTVSPVRIARDPMVAAYPILRPYVGGGFA